MTRIIAGDFGGRKLAVPKVGTRPTTDRVREAIFSRLDHADALRGARVLDLYAGSGALGLESLSRGAAEATFVESATPAVRVVEGNIKEFGLGTRATVVRERVLPFLERTTKTFTLAFLDPPYDIADGDLAAALAALAPRLDDGSSRRARGLDPQAPARMAAGPGTCPVEDVRRDDGAFRRVRALGFDLWPPSSFLVPSTRSPSATSISRCVRASFSTRVIIAVAHNSQKAPLLDVEIAGRARSISRRPRRGNRGRGRRGLACRLLRDRMAPWRSSRAFGAEPTTTSSGRWRS